MSEKTKTEIQIMRGIALLLVVFHHIINAAGYIYSNQIVAVISSVHVQTFFLISGFLFEYNIKKYKQNGIKVFLKKKSRELAVPYFCWLWLFLILVYAIKYTIPSLFSLIEQKGYSNKPILAQLLDPFVLKNPQIESLWFIYVLFFIFLINWFLPAGKYKWIVFLSAIVISSVVSYFFYDTEILLPYRVIRNFQWFYLGRICVFYREQIRKMQSSFVFRIVIPAIFIVFCFLEIFDPIRLFIPDKVFRAVLYSIERPILTISGIFIIGFLALILFKINKLGKVVKFLGDQSYAIYLIHNPWFVSPVSLVISKFLTVNIGTTLVALIVIVLLSMGTGLLLKKSRILSILFLGSTKLTNRNHKK